ncbi:MAG: hypothetical protein KY459_07920 [Acidobacteria bacterium]|nr:hypothetical protein [Acidobacteriota bacterium]
MTLTRSLLIVPSLLLLLVCGPDPAPEPTPDVTDTSHTDDDSRPPSEPSPEADDDTAYEYDGELPIADTPAIGDCTLPEPAARKYKKINVFVISGAVAIHSGSSRKHLKQKTEGLVWKYSDRGLEVVFDDTAVIVDCQDLPGGNSECKVEPFCFRDKEPNEYKYTIEVTDAIPLDPKVIVDP